MQNNKILFCPNLCGDGLKSYFSSFFFYDFEKNIPKLKM